MTELDKALKLVERGLPVFKVRLGDDGSKTPLSERGHLDASLDPGLVTDWFTESPHAKVGVYVGAANLVVLDVDTKNGVDGWESLEDRWLIPPDTFGYDTPSGGRHLIYRVPAGFDGHLAPSAKYRGMPGVDIRAGSSWVLWNGPAPEDDDSFSEAPTWLLDQKTQGAVTDQFTGDTKDWFATLEPGEADPAVLKAISRVSEDMSHSDMVASTYEAIRLGAEGHSGVSDLLDTLETAWKERDPGNHTTPEEMWDWKFQEALASGIRKHGDAIELRKNLPEYRLSSVPDTLPNSLVTGAPGGKSEVLSLVRSLAEAHTESMTALSILWNAPVTKTLAREWGLEFVYKLIQDAEARVEEPDLAVAVRDEPEVQAEKREGVTLLSDEERAKAAEQYTFIDRYQDKFMEAIGFIRPEFAKPLAWTVLSMAAGRQGVIPKSGGFGTNLWFTVLGHSGQGKSIHAIFARNVIDGFLKGHETHWNTGAGSPEGIGESLVRRDGLPSALFQDEAASFYKDLLAKDWMKSLTNMMADWYMGTAHAPQKVRLAELRGKTAEISFNYFTISTPEDTLRRIDEDMFGTGFMARMAWVMGPPPKDTDERYKARRSDLTKSGVSRQAMELSGEMAMFARSFPSDQRTEIWGSKDAIARLEKAYEDMDKKAKRNPKYKDIIQPSIVRLDETMWKCAALIAMYRGADEFDLDDALVSLYYVEEWYATLLEVSREIAGAYMRDANVMVDYIRENGGSVPHKTLVKAFGNMIVRSRGELKDRIDFLCESGQLRAKSDNGNTIYELGG